MRKKLLWLALLVTISILLTSVLSVFVLSGHSCSGHGDAECVFCAACEAFGKIIMHIGVSSFWRMLAPCLLLILVIGRAEGTPSLTLIALKVKLSD